MRSNTRALGREGEDWIAQKAIAQGWEVVARNWQCRGAELDLVLRRGENLVIVEVKTRKQREVLSNPFAVLSWGKRQNLVRGVELYLSRSRKLSYFSVAIYLAVVVLEANRSHVRWFPVEI